MNKRFAIILGVLIIAFGGLFLFNKKDSNKPSSGEKTTSKSTPTEHKAGKGTTGVTLTEYGDFQCPACGQYYPIVKQIKQKYGDQITVQFRHFPLTQVHKNAMIAARAAEAAGLQDKFFEMHDLLYENQQTWSTSANPEKIFEDYAAKVAINVEKFKEDLKSDQVNRSIQADLSLAQDKGFSSTPTFEINGKKIENPRSLEDFEKAIDQAIKDQQKDKNQ